MYTVQYCVSLGVPKVFQIPPPPTPLLNSLATVRHLWVCSAFGPVPAASVSSNIFLLSARRTKLFQRLLSICSNIFLLCARRTKLFLQLLFHPTSFCLVHAGLNCSSSSYFIQHLSAWCTQDLIFPAVPLSSNIFLLGERSTKLFHQLLFHPTSFCSVHAGLNCSSSSSLFQHLSVWCTHD